jgi:hypothetical protein
MLPSAVSSARAAAPAASGFSFAKPAAPSAAEQAFNDYAKKTPAQKMRDAILGTMGLTEDQLKAMSPKEREAIEAKIKEIMKHKIEEAMEKKDKTGAIVDVKA